MCYANTSGCSDPALQLAVLCKNMSAAAATALIKALTQQL